MATYGGGMTERSTNFSFSGSGSGTVYTFPNTTWMTVYIFKAAIQIAGTLVLNTPGATASYSLTAISGFPGTPTFTVPPGSYFTNSGGSNMNVVGMYVEHIISGP